jgi:exosortase A-associated hydrolase 1
MRRIVHFACNDYQLAGTLDLADSVVGLILVSGGNEIRSGAHAGQARLAADIAAKGYSVFRYDRCGIGDSEGDNGGFESSATDIAAALEAFRSNAPHIKRIIAFGNCDAATALAIFHAGCGIDALLLANPWVIEGTAKDADAPTAPSSAAIRARYWSRIKNPRSLIDLFSGKINLGKLAGGMLRAAKKDIPSALADRLSLALCNTNVPVKILIAQRDTTAMAFMGVWNDSGRSVLRSRANIEMATCDTASHSFADAIAKTWLADQLVAYLQRY